MLTKLLSCSTQSAPRLISSWIKPPARLTKINADAHITAQYVGLGAVARDEHGELLWAAVRRVPAGLEVEAAEAEAVRFGMQIAHRLGILNIWIETLLRTNLFFIILFWVLAFSGKFLTGKKWRVKNNFEIMGCFDSICLLEVFITWGLSILLLYGQDASESVSGDKTKDVAPNHAASSGKGPILDVVNSKVATAGMQLIA
ncbi:uncharacterized protein LOC110689136 isoform X2 [Chenopodium quinoa]|uniref:uncharacterized protein LOC110689136 isoform X2 n=1 Tax=Chenopodium quinoa TaxID=63459 RepID=UPI000B77532F|nr:uncharacterized protein LOC110689136 isoform X2 [Chenopodium quinoa]